MKTIPIFVAALTLTACATAPQTVEVAEPPTTSGEGDDDDERDAATGAPE